MEINENTNDVSDETKEALKSTGDYIWNRFVDEKGNKKDPYKVDADHPNLLPCWSRLFKTLRT